MSYAPSFTDSFRRAATYVDKILGSSGFSVGSRVV
jgi:hypothetical protein